MNTEKDKIYLGLDVGFGDVKLVLSFAPENQSARKKILTKFPTAIAYAKEGIIGDLGEGERKYAFIGREYFVGSPALQCRDVFSTRDINFLLTYSPLLAFAAIEQIICQEKELEVELETINSAPKFLCLGMPLAHFHSKRSQLLDIMKKNQVSDEVLTFDSIDIRAQGQGILFDFMLDDNSHPIADRLDLNVLVVDIGFNTVDILGVVQGSPSREWSGMLDRGGICRIGEQVGNFLQREFNFELPEQSIKDVLQKKHISLYGATKDVSFAIRKASEEYADWLLQEIRSRWEGFLKKADRLILAGGGAYYVHDDFAAIYPKEFLFVPEKPEFSNAIGFHKYLENAYGQ
jgi:plasmid segregation protein ParM